MAINKKKVKRKWYEILASKNFNNVSIGEAMAYGDDNLKGRVVNVNLGNLTRDMKLQNIRIKFEVEDVKEGKAYTGVKGYGLASSYIKRMVRAGRSRVDDSFLVITKDNVKLRMKPLVLTRYKAQKNVLKELRNIVKKDFTDYIKKEDYNKFVSDLVSKKLQRDLRRKLTKVYPVSLVEVRLMNRV